MIDPITFIIWCIGVVAMAATAWIQDRRDIRREKGEAAEIRKRYGQRISRLEESVRKLRNLLISKGVNLKDLDGEDDGYDPDTDY